MHRAFATATVILLFLLFLAPSSALARVSQAIGIGLRFDPSTRTVGMGGTGTAVWWGRNPSAWANPALLGYHRGVSYADTESQLVPDLADDVFYTGERFTVGAFGVGFEAAGHPIGELLLDQGEQAVVDEGGDASGSFRSYQRIEAWSLGVSLGTVWRSVCSCAPWWSRLADLGLGISRRDAEIFLAPDQVLQPGVSGRTDGTSLDFGLLARIVPVDTIDPVLREHWLATDLMRDVGVRLSIGYGYAVQGYNEEQVTFPGTDQADPFAKVTRKGFGAHVSLGGPQLFEGQRGSRLVRALAPVLEVGITRDAIEESASGVTDEMTGFGWEVTLLRAFSIRRGRYEDPVGQIDGDTEGWSAGLDVDGVGGFRFDRGTRPQASDLDTVDIDTWMVHADVLGIVDLIRGRASFAEPTAR